MENHKIASKEIKIYWNKWKDILCSWIGRLNIVKIAILSKLSIWTIQSLSNSQQDIFAEIGKLIPKFIFYDTNARGPEEPKQFFKGGTKLEEPQLTISKLTIKWP